MTVGHEPVGVIEKLGRAAAGYREGQRGATTPSGYKNACLGGGAGMAHGWKPLGGWKLGDRESRTCTGGPRRGHAVASATSHLGSYKRKKYRSRSVSGLSPVLPWSLARRNIFS
jgi:hypothetical protein